MLSHPSVKVYSVHQALLIISPVLLAIVEYITLGKMLAMGSANRPPATHALPRG